MEVYKIYIAGEFFETANPITVQNPYSNEVFASTYKADNNHLERAIKAAQMVQKQMAELPSFKRYEILMAIASEIGKSRQEFAELLTKESGKPIRYALGEIDRAAQTFTIAAEESKRLPGELMSLDWTKSAEGKEGIVKYFPVGIVGGITPFNFPLNLGVHKIAPAIATGCPIIVKPASPTPLSLLKLAQIIDKTELPKGAFSVLPMDRETGNMLVTDDRIKLLSFTGSPSVGWKMKREAGKKKVVLELGGNAAVIITPSADLNMAIQKNLVGGYAYSGQICIHVQRVFVQEEKFDEFVSEFKQGIQKLKYGNPLEHETEISVMIDQANADRVEEWVADAVGAGAKIICGGKKDGAYYYPTLITNTTNQMKVCSEEVFGPVVVVEKYKTMQDAVNMVNDSDFGLQAGIFTNDISEMNYAFNHLDVGGVILNDVPTFRVDHMPYGGNKDSGLGREGVKYAMMDMLEPRILVKPII
jgi:acyl-CoA reductase-like NAD-dependent aldehyde dehydrogenase